MSSTHIPQKQQNPRHHYTPSNPFTQFYAPSTPSQPRNTAQHFENHHRNAEQVQRTKNQYRAQRFTTCEEYNRPKYPHSSSDKVAFRQVHKMKESCNSIKDSVGSRGTKLSVKRINSHCKLNSFETQPTQVFDLKQTINSHKESQHQPSHDKMKKMKEQIQEQDKMIEKLRKILQSLTQRLYQKQNKIHQLMKNIKVNNPEDNHELIHSKHHQTLMKKINDVQCKFSFIQEQQSAIQIQNKQLKQQIETICGGILETIAGKHNSMKRKVQEFISLTTDTTQATFEMMKNYLSSISFALGNLREITGSPELKETARFTEFQKRVPEFKKNDKVGLEDSSSSNQTNSYFFHPSQLTHISKIQQLYYQHDFEPLRCYLDPKNRLKYKDSNTFVFDRKGSMIYLNEKEKRYYRDKGLMI